MAVSQFVRISNRNNKPTKQPTTMKILTHKMPWHIPQIEAGWGNGYIGVPPEHPWFGIDYNDIQCDVHGGLTYSADHKPKEKPDGYWWIGFDTGHYSDNKFNCPESYVDEQIDSLYRQAVEACNV